MEKLFAVVLGGRAPKCNIELHDVVFVTGEKIEDTYHQLLDKWFGLPEKMHIDCYLTLDIVDGFEVSLVKEPVEQDEKLYFINMGAYKAGDFMEHHANTFLIDIKASNINSRAKQSLLKGLDEVHKDDLYDIDDLISITEINGYNIKLSSTEKTENLNPVNGYHVLPKTVVKAYLEAKTA